MGGVSVLGPAHTRSVVRGDSIAMISDCSLQYVNHARPIFMVMNRAEDATGFDSNHPHAQLASGHTLDFEAKVKRGEQLHCHAFGLK